MKKNLLPLLLSLFLVVILSRCSKPAHLQHDEVQNKLDSLVTAFHGTAGVYVRNLKTGETFSINADTIFPTASIIKIPIAVAMFKKINQSPLTYHTKLLYRESMAYGGSGLMHNFKDSTKIQLSKIITMMLGRSDNTAAVWCQKLAGSAQAINQWLANHGFQHTRDNSGAPERPPIRKKAYKEYGWGQTTPKEMATLLVMIRQDKVISPAASERIYRDLSRNYWDEDALFQIPPTAHTASKSGAVNASRSEVVLVDAPHGSHGSYVFYVGTKNNKDKSWKPSNEAYQLARNVSKLLWNYFEPQSNWQPPKKAKRYWE